MTDFNQFYTNESFYTTYVYSCGDLEPLMADTNEYDLTTL